jgi:acyl transferase domain-containing protein
VDIRELMFATGEAADAALADTAITQPALFTLEYALARLWQSWGLTPDTMIGHSVGEYVAATVAGVFDLADALRLVATRGRLMAAMPAGAMAALSMSADAVTPLLPDGLSVATVNGPGTCVIAGPAALLEEFTSGLPKKVGAKRLRTSHAFHSPMMDPILPEFAAAVAAVPRHAPKVPFLSTVSGAPITGEQATDPGYWAAQLRETVRFGDCVARLIADGAPLFVECGPGRQLAGLVRMQTRGSGPAAVPSLPGPTDKLDDVATLLTAAGTLWTAGVAVSPPTAGRRVPLPPYPYQRTRHWVDADEPAEQAAAPVDDRRQPADRWFAVPTWHQQVPVTMPELPASCLLFAAGELGAETARRLRAAGCAVTEVVAGPAYGRTSDGFTVRPDEAADYAAVLADLGEAPEWVVHTWSLATEPSRDDVEATWDAQRLGLFSVVRLVQAVAGAGLVPRLDVVTTATQQVVGGDLTRPEHATIAGVVRSAPYDVPGLRVRQLDVDDTTNAADLVAALGRPGDDDLVALRGGRMWTLDYAQTRLPEPPADVIRDRGVYLITGGLGGLGLTIAEHLAEHRSARLVLTSRSGLPPIDQWDRAHDERTSHAIAAVRRMTAAGAEVVTAAVDVSDVDGLRRLREETLARFGRLDGIVHAAGVAGGGLIETRPIEDMRTVLAPKLAGTVALRAVFGADELDFVSLFSSVTGTAGGLAETDYCAANAYLDAHAQSAGWRAPVRSLGWTGWLEVGMLANLFRTTERVGGPPEPIGHPLVTEVRRSENGTVVATGTISAATHWALADHLIDGVPVLPGTAQVEAMRVVADAALPGTGAVELSEVLFLEPLRVPDGQVAELRIVLRPQGTDSAEVTLSHGGTTYGRATAARSTARRDEPVDLAAVRDRCTIRPELVAMSHNPPGALVSYGARWRNIREVWRSEREQLTLLEVPDESRGDLADWAISPAVLDQATFVFNGTGGGALPMGYGRIVVHDRLPARVWVHRLLAPATGQDLRTDSFTLVDDAGTVLVSVTDFLLRRVADAPRPPAPVSSAAVPDDAAQRWLAPAEGVAAFLRATAANAGGHVVITPRPLAWVLEQNRIDAEKILGGGDALGDSPHETASTGSWSSPTETVVAGIWSAVLGLPEVSAEDDFFALGGNSLVAVQLITQIREATGVRLPLRSIFETPTVAAMAATVEELRERSEPEPAPAMTIPRLARTSD